MLLQLEIIAQRISPCNAKTITCTLGNARTSVLIAVNREVVQGRKRTIVVGIILHTKSSTELQVLDELHLSKSIGRNSHVLRLVVGIGHHGAIGVTVGIVPIAIAGVIVRTSILSIVAIDRSQWRNAESTAQRIVILVAHTDTILLIINHRHLLTYLQEVIDDLVFRIDTEVIA